MAVYGAQRPPRGVWTGVPNANALSWWAMRLWSWQDSGQLFKAAHDAAWTCMAVYGAKRPPRGVWTGVPNANALSWWAMRLWSWQTCWHAIYPPPKKTACRLDSLRSLLASAKAAGNRTAKHRSQSNKHHSMLLKGGELQGGSAGGGKTAVHSISRSRWCVHVHCCTAGCGSAKCGA
jgi:hypothetical protein